ncbi:MAG: TatD family hydrolase, partial [Candidatus Glassbacteria bacterium]
SVPLERILLETDAPYLSPVPFRGKTNEPAYLVKVLEGLAGLLGDKELLRVAAHTTMNTIALFGMEGVLGGEFLYLLNKDID